MNVSVEFLQSTRVDFYGPKQYHPGERAGFPEDLATILIGKGVARRVRSTQQPLVAAALKLPDPRIKQLAQALENLGHLDEWETQRARLRAEIAAIEKQEARAIALGNGLPGGVSEQKRLLVEQLQKIEKEIQMMTEQYEPLFIELKQAVHAYIEHAFRDALTTRLAPSLRDLASLVRKAEGIFDGMLPGLSIMDELRAVAQIAEFEGARLDTMLSEVVREIVGADTLTSPVSGRPSIDNLAVLLYGIATAMQYTKAQA